MDKKERRNNVDITVTPSAERETKNICSLYKYNSFFFFLYKHAMMQLAVTCNVIYFYFTQTHVHRNMRFQKSPWLRGIRFVKEKVFTRRDVWRFTSSIPKDRDVNDVNFSILYTESVFDVHPSYYNISISIRGPMYLRSTNFGYFSPHAHAHQRFINSQIH